MLDARRLRLLRDLDRLGTIAAVAQAHTCTPSAVSQQLITLEREAGTGLLERTGRRVTLTPAGQVLARHAETVLAALEEARAALAAVHSGPAGPFRIGAFPSAMRTVLPAALVTLGRRYPALELLVTELDPAAVPSALRERRLDAGLTHDYDVAPAGTGTDLASAPLFEEAVHLAVPSALAVTRFGPELAGHPWILATPGTLCHEVSLRICHAAGFTPVVRHQADDFGAVLALVGAGLGVSLVPELAAARPPADVRLLPAPARRRTRLAFRRGTGRHPAMAALITALAGAGGEEHRSGRHR